MLSRVRLFLLSRNVWHAVLGILAELVLVVVIITSGFLVCVFWWGIFK